jgi:hypothetical protein
MSSSRQADRAVVAQLGSQRAAGVRPPPRSKTQCSPGSQLPVPHFTPVRVAPSQPDFGAHFSFAGQQPRPGPHQWSVPRHWTAVWPTVDEIRMTRNAPVAIRARIARFPLGQSIGVSCRSDDPATDGENKRSRCFSTSAPQFYRQHGIHEIAFRRARSAPCLRPATAAARWR